MDFYQQYCDIRMRLGIFRKNADPDCVRAVSAIDALSNRAKDVAEGCNYGGRFGAGGADFSAESLFEKANEYLKALERGEQPFKGRFAEPRAH